MTLPSLLSRTQPRFLRQQAPARSTSLSRMAWHRFCRNKLSVASLVIIGLFVLMALLGSLITPDHTPYCNQQYLELATLKPFTRIQFTYVDDGLPKPSGNPIGTMLHGRPLGLTAIPTYAATPVGDSLDIEAYTGSTPNHGPLRRVARSQVVSQGTRLFPLGTDGYGRDVLSMIIIGSRVSLSVGFIAVLIALLIGITLGALAAYYGGWVDNLITWFINVVWSIPTVLLVIAITFALGKGFWQVFIAVGLTMWVDIARVVRGQVYSIKEKEYVEAARALGLGPSAPSSATSFPTSRAPSSLWRPPTSPAPSSSKPASASSASACSPPCPPGAPWSRKTTATSCWTVPIWPSSPAWPSCYWSSPSCSSATASATPSTSRVDPSFALPSLPISHL